MERDVAIIGSGATGVSLFGQLVRGAAEHVRSITLVDTQEPGRGPVFGDPDDDVLGNTSAGIQSLFPEEHMDLLDHCHAEGRPVDPTAFVPRNRVGAYCRARFEEHARLARAKDITVTHRRERANRIAPAPDGHGVHLGDGTRLVASDVAVCVGLGSPLTPDGFADHTTHPRYVGGAFPTTAVRARLPGAGARVLVVGSGLTAVDTAVLLCRDGHQVTIASRSGVLPAVRSHTRSRAGPPGPGAGRGPAARPGRRTRRDLGRRIGDPHPRAVRELSADRHPAGPNRRRRTGGAVPGTDPPVTTTSVTVEGDERRCRPG